MSQDDLDQIEALIKKHKQNVPDGGCMALVFFLFICGVFKGCGY